LDTAFEEGIRELPQRSQPLRLHRARQAAWGVAFIQHANTRVQHHSSLAALESLASTPHAACEFYVALALCSCPTRELPRRLQQLSSCSSRVFGKHAPRRTRVLRRLGAAQLQADPSLALPHPGAHPRTCSVAGLPPGGHGIRLRVLPDCPCVAARPLPLACIVMLVTALTRTVLVNLSPTSSVFPPYST
jgi:hypothetical protein